MLLKDYLLAKVMFVFSHLLIIRATPVTGFGGGLLSAFELFQPLNIHPSYCLFCRTWAYC
jgi:hypothetical protein